MDTTTLLIIVVVILLVMFLLNRNRAGGYGPLSGTGGNERPRYDDPDYTSAGSIGGGAPPLHERSVGEAPSGGERPRHDDPNYRSGGSIGG